MILIDTSIWVDHLNKPDARFADTGRRELIVVHPYIVGELAAGNLSNWHQTVRALRLLPQLAAVSEDEYYSFTSEGKLMGSGLSYVDIHILASACATPDCFLWTRDKRLRAKAEMLERAYSPN